MKRARINPLPVTPASGRHSRAAKDQAKLKLDAQARELAELNREASMSTSRSTRPTRQAASRAQFSRTPTRSAPSRVLGTRTSARLRGPQEEDEWQPIPEEWLNETKRPRKSSVSAAKTGLENDEESISDLTELSDDGGETSASPSVSQNGKSTKASSNGIKSTEPKFEIIEDKPEPPEDPLANFVEWETVIKFLHHLQKFRTERYFLRSVLHSMNGNILQNVLKKLRIMPKKLYTKHLSMTSSLRSRMN